MNAVVKLERHDAIGIVTVDSPPVNALSAAVRGGIFDCMKEAIADPQHQGHRADLRRPHLHCRRRHHRIRQAAEAARPARGAGGDGEFAEADRRRHSRHRARRRPRGRAGMPLSRGRQGSAARPARSEARPAARRRRHAAPAARGRPGTGGQDDRQRRSDQRGRSAEERPDRGDRRRSGLRRRSLCPQGGGREAPAAQAARRRLQARRRQGRYLDLHQCGRSADQEGARAWKRRSPRPMPCAPPSNCRSTKA